MDTVVTAVRNLFGFVTGVRPRFRSHGGTSAENLALQNIQVGIRRYINEIESYLMCLDLGETENGARIHVCAASSMGQRT